MRLLHLFQGFLVILSVQMIDALFAIDPTCKSIRKILSEKIHLSFQITRQGAKVLQNDPLNDPYVRTLAGRLLLNLADQPLHATARTWKQEWRFVAGTSLHSCSLSQF